MFDSHCPIWIKKYTVRKTGAEGRGGAKGEGGGSEGGGGARGGSEGGRRGGGGTSSFVETTSMK